MQWFRRFGIGAVCAGWLAAAAMAQVAGDRVPTPPPSPPTPPKAPAAAPGNPAEAVPANTPAARPATPTAPPPLTPFPGLRPGSLDVSRLNEVMAQILDPLGNSEPAIDRLFLVFDPQRTDLAADKLGVTAGAALHRTVWSESPSKLTFTLAAQYLPPIRDPASAVFEGEAAWHTDVVAMSNYLVPVIVAKLTQPRRPSLMERLQNPAQRGAATTAASAPPPGEPGLFDPAEEFRKRLIAELASAGPIRTFDDLCDLVTKASSHRFVIQTEYIAALSRAIDAASDPDRRNELTARLAEARLQRDRQLQVRPLVDRSADGRAETLSVTIFESDMSEQLHVERLQAVISADAIRLTAQVRMVRGLEMYALFKPVAAAVLGRLQEGRPEDVDGYRRIIESYFLLERDLVLGPKL